MCGWWVVGLACRRRRLGLAIMDNWQVTTKEFKAGELTIVVSICECL